MVLIVNGQKCQCNEREVGSFIDQLCRSASARSRSAAFKANKIEINSGFGVLYIHQGEMATLCCDRPVLPGVTTPRFIASDDATSCQIVILRSPNKCVAAHLDFPSRVASFFGTAKQFLSDTTHATPIAVHIIGGFTDRHHFSRDLLLESMGQLLTEENQVYELGVFCADILNTRKLSFEGEPSSRQMYFPVVYGVIYDCVDSRVLSATLSWSARGPLPALRLSRLQSRSVLAVNVFDPIRCCLVVEPFRYDSDIIDPIYLTKEVMRTHSTTPDQEPNSFFEGFYASRKLAFHCPDPMVSWFSNGRLSFTCAHYPSEGNEFSASGDAWRAMDCASAYAVNHPLTNVSAALWS